MKNKMEKKRRKRLRMACLSFVMAASLLLGDVLAAEAISLDDTEAYPVNTYNMYRDGSGKNIESRENLQYPPSDEEGSISNGEEEYSEEDYEEDKKKTDNIQAIGGMNLGTPGLEMIKSFEACRLTAYKVLPSEQYWTIGWGHYGPDVYEGMQITQTQADAYLKQDVSRFVENVNNFSKANNVNLNQNQFDALVSFTYNVGTKWMNSSTIRTYLLNGIEKYTDAQITNAFLLWNKAGGQVLPGLTRRRQAEAQLFLSKVASLPPTISNHTIPRTIKEGSSFTVAGKIWSDSLLREVSAGVYKDGILVTGKTINPNAKTYSLSEIDNYIAFRKLSVGTYEYVVSATNLTAKVKLIDEKFEVVGNHIHSYRTVTTKANPTANGKIVRKCDGCNQVESTTIVYAPTTMKLSTTSYTYTGKAKNPSVTVIDAKGKTVDASNYSVLYESGRINVGTYKIKVKFRGCEYEGELQKTIKINPASQKITGITAYQKNTSSKPFTLNTKLTKGDSKLSYASNNKAVVTVNRETGKVTIKGAGTATITVTAPATKNYKAASYKVTVKVNPLKVTLNSVESRSSGKMLVKWSKNSKVTGYQIQYSKKADFSSDKKLNVEGKATVFKTITGMTKGAKYYVRVRCYQVVNGVKYYSAYSNVKTITVKK